MSDNLFGDAGARLNCGHIIGLDEFPRVRLVQPIQLVSAQMGRKALRSFLGLAEPSGEGADHFLGPLCREVSSRPA